MHVPSKQMKKNKERLRCSRNLSFESHSKCRPSFSAEGWHEGCLNDSLILVVGNRCLYRKFCILWHKVTAQHTHRLAHSRHSKNACSLNKFPDVTCCSLWNLSTALLTQDKIQERQSVPKNCTKYFLSELILQILNHAKWTNTHPERNAEPPEKKTSKPSFNIPGYTHCCEGHSLGLFPSGQAP